MQYDIAGNVTSTTDARNNTTTADFSDRFGSADSEARSNSAPADLGGLMCYAFATRITNAANQSAYTQFSYYLGKPVNSEDLNGVVTASYYNDPLDRPTQLIHDSQPSSPSFRKPPSLTTTLLASSLPLAEAAHQG